MGCCNDKTINHMNKTNQVIVSEEEDIIKEQENIIPFSKVNIIKIEKVLIKYESAGCLSSVLLKSALSKLQFEENDFTDPDSTTYKFIMQLRGKNKLYSIDTILLSGVVLGSGNINEKATVLFNLYDKDKAKVLEKTNINCMIKDVINFSVKKIPIIAIDNNEEPAPNTLKSDRINKHINSLWEKRESYIAKIQNLLLGNKINITLDEFIDKISEDIFLQTLLWSYQIRLTLLE